MTDATVVSSAFSEERSSPERLMVKEDVVEMVLGALRRGEQVLAVARAYGLDPKTVRAWRRRGQYVARRPPRAGGGLLTPFATWLRSHAPELAFNTAVLHRELREQGFLGSEIIVRRAVRPWRLAAIPVATVRFESAGTRRTQISRHTTAYGRGRARRTGRRRKGKWSRA